MTTQEEISNHDSLLSLRRDVDLLDVRGAERGVWGWVMAGFIEFRGNSKSLSEWAASAGISRQRLAQRLSSGWSVENALTAPAATRRVRPPQSAPNKAKYMRRWREKSGKKYRVIQMTQCAIRSGKLVRGPCEVCGTSKRVGAHHDDYNKPLDVRWLCGTHHRIWHAENGPGANGDDHVVYPRRARFVGVRRVASGRWLAEVFKNHKHVWGKRFSDEVEAAKARDEAAIRIFGAKARLNFPRGAES